WLRLAAAGRPRYACTDRPVALRRVHAGSMTRSLPDEVRRFQVAKFLSALELGRRHISDEQRRQLRDRVLAAVYRQWSSGGEHWWRIPRLGAAWLRTAAADPGMLTYTGWWRCLAGPGWAWYELRRQSDALREQTLAGQADGPEVIGY
ncbi:MAG: hypothetical protein KJO38_09675, partial [Gammaproteobacteria bacterium]|nr:hypothetical protein [Gammaproteobacteria bacterium]